MSDRIWFFFKYAWKNVKNNVGYAIVCPAIHNTNYGGNHDCWLCPFVPAICYIDSGKHDLVMSFCVQQSATLTMADMTLGYAILCPAVCNTNSGKHDSWLCHFVSSNLKH